jgi:nonribosomal peptide synthetase protein VioO
MAMQKLRLYQGEPDRVAIRDNGRELSYADIEARVRAAARDLGDRPGVVGVPATHRADTVVSLFAVWAAGGAYCPLDPDFPAARRLEMLAAARSGGPDPDDLAYVLFTSGSTGAPKPVLTPHSAIAAAVSSVRDLFGLVPTDRVLQFASLNWDTCFEEILPSLGTGACLVFHDDAHAGSFPRFLRMLSREGITVVDLPTAFWHELVHHLVSTGDRLPPSLRLVVIGGEAANPARVADWHALPSPRPTLLNTYGCTETTLITHACELVNDGGTVPIGRPLPHVRQHITADGELLIGGPSLALGYRDRPEATAARFVTVGGDRWFRTGDRVAAGLDGVLTVSGRLDAEIKVRGIRVDPAEVEAHIAGHPDVGAVGVTGVRMADHTVLAAYVVPRPSADPSSLAAAIREHLRARVPAHLIPSYIRVVADLVYTASGKVDRRRLEEALA